MKLLMGCSEPPDVDARSHGGYTALHVAAMNSRHDVIELLVVVYKADADATDYAGRKPIYYLAHDATAGKRSSAFFRRFTNTIGIVYSRSLETFRVLILLLGRQEEHPACKTSTNVVRTRKGVRNSCNSWLLQLWCAVAAC